MKKNIEGTVRIVEIPKGADWPKLVYGYTSSSYYDVSIAREADSWVVKLVLRPFEKPFEKIFEENLSEEARALFIEEPRVFAAELNGKRVGWLELGYSRWNNRMRAWEFMVVEGFRRSGIGTLLMNHAVKVAKERGARMLVLETQSCNVPAINFYFKYGFELIGFDAAAYSNEDIKKREVRLEFGLKI
jgi:ribosomal protein S18 acetylase RimI-like enzyme